ncbi:hypothetical protein AB0C76_32920 [Kitasatospora sp. NPDC048722]|uniref:hypothetical protein n=1 Tax=Kitasatospora sp. NPDC048722 TaxID=3155639 RepID=UPI0033CC9191
MARTGRTYTRHFQLETRQHELLGVDLGEGAPRRALILGLILFAAWDGLLLLVLGLPSRFTFTLYVAPPALAVGFGAQHSRSLDRRWNLTRWAITLRYLLLGHRPIICGGRRAAHRSEWLGRRARWGSRLDLLLRSPLGGLVERWLGPEDRIPSASGVPLRLDARPRLYGPDAVGKAYGRKALHN